MYNREMGMEIPQEFNGQSQDKQLEKEGEQQETIELLMKEFQKEEEEVLFSKDKDKEKTTKSRIKKALCAITAGLILFGSAEAGFARGRGESVAENEKVEMSNESTKLQIQVGTKLEHIYRGDPDAIISDAKDNGILILSTANGEKMELRPTKNPGIYEYDKGGSELSDGAIDISKGKMEFMFDYAKMDKDIDIFFQS